MPGAPTDLLAKVHLFSDLDQRELKQIAESMNEYSFETGRAVVTEGAGGAGFFIIEEGKAKVSVEGGEVRTLGTGDYFGEVALITDTKRTATVTAETPLKCWGLTSWAFRAIVANNSAIAWKLLQALARLVS